MAITHHTSGYIAWTLTVCAGLLLISNVAVADVIEIPVEQRDAFRVCADARNMPYSNDQGEGFENRIAQLFADHLELKIEYYYFPQRLGFVRRTLRNEIEQGKYACDVIMGVPEHFDAAAPTMSYYRSTYLLVYRGDWEHADEVQTPEDIASLPEEKRENIRFGIFDRGPSQLWVFKNGLMNKASFYQSMPGDARVHVGDVMQDLIDGNITHTIIWGPIGGWWVKHKSGGTDIRYMKMQDDPDSAQLQVEYDIAMATRHGDHYMRGMLDDLINRYQDEINVILHEYGVPFIDED